MQKPFEPAETDICKRSTGITSTRPSEALAVDWMSNHARIMTFWEDRLVADNADMALIETVHKQAEWLNMMLCNLPKLNSGKT